MRTGFDQLAKDACKEILSSGAKVEIEVSIAPDPQRIDLVFEPDPDKLDALTPFGLMARIAREGPTTRDTLLLRILGRGKVFTQAMAELAALPNGELERELVLPIVLRLREALPYPPQTPDDQEFFMTAQNIVEQIRLEGQLEGWREGQLEGRREGQREGRQEGASQTLLRVVRARFDRIDSAIEKRILSASNDELDRWAVRFVTAQRIEDLFDI